MTALITPIIGHCVDVFLFWFVWQLCDIAKTKGWPILKEKIQIEHTRGGTAVVGGTAEVS